MNAEQILVSLRRKNCTHTKVDLIIDIGNTRAKLFVFDGDEVAELVFCSSETLDKLDELTRRYTFRRGILSTVARLGEEAEERLGKLTFPLERLTSATPLPFTLCYKPFNSEVPLPMPSSMGADRIAALVGGMASYPGTPLLIIDAGTCVTYELIDDEGVYRGGSIAPGLTLRFKAMHEHTALLPLIDASGDLPPVGYDTETAMRSGVVFGFQFEIEGHIRRWVKHYPKLQVLLTGGNNFTFGPELESIIHHESDLLARGLRAILNSLNI